MRDKRPVDELSIEELERILAIRRREARLKKLGTYEERRVAMPPNGATPDEAQGPETPMFIDEPDLEDDDLPASAPPKQTVPPPPPLIHEGAPQFEDEIEVNTRSSERMRKVRSWWNRALTLIEVAAALGLVVLFVALFQSFQAISQKTNSLQADFEATSRAQLVTPTPTPVIDFKPRVLPTGHTFDGRGFNDENAAFNLEEIPAQYRDQYVSFAAQIQTTRPTPSKEGPTRVRIPRINVDSVIVTGDDWESLKLGVGHNIGSANPGQRGNMVLSGHNDIYGEVFRYLDRLQPGDEIIVNTLTKEYVYVVQPNQERNETRGYRVVLPTDVWVLGSSGDTRQLTLISCYPYQVDNKRIVVFAILKS